MYIEDVLNCHTLNERNRLIPVGNNRANTLRDCPIKNSSPLPLILLDAVSMDRDNKIIMKLVAQATICAGPGISKYIITHIYLLIYLKNKFRVSMKLSKI